MLRSGRVDIFNIETKKDRLLTAAKLSSLYIFASVIWILIYEKLVEVYFQGRIPETLIYIVGVGFGALAIFFFASKTLKKFNEDKKTIEDSIRQLKAKEETIKLANEGLKQQNELIEEVLKGANVLVIRLDKNFNIVRASKNIYCSTGFKSSVLRDQPLSKIIGAEYIDEMLENIEEEDASCLELEMHTRYGEKKYMRGIVSRSRVKSQSKIYFNLLLCDISESKDLQKRVNYLDSYDRLTDLPNRNVMEKTFNRLLPEIKEIGNPIAFLNIDIDDFAYINENKGYHAGDQLLIDMANVLKAHTKKTDIVSRISQDRFGLIFTKEESYKAIDRRVNEILKATKLQWKYQDRSYMISSTIGVSIYPDSALDFMNLIKNANIALECAKENSRSSYEYYSPDNNCTISNDLALLSDIKLALINKSFYMNYQPIVNLKTGSIENVESLIRWFHPDKGYISPAYFIQVAERAGIIDEIGDYTLDEVFRQKERWNKSDYKLEKVSINISAISFSKKEFASKIEDKLKKYNLEGGEIVLELTESSFAYHLDKIKENIDKIRALGIQVAMDDFGSGYSSLTRLKDLPIDYLKLDRAFIVSLLDENGQEIIRPLISLANALGKNVIAEGIETKEQLDILKDMGCQYGQGYFLARPMSSEDLIKG